MQEPPAVPHLTPRLDVTQEERLWAMLAHLLCYVGYFGVVGQYLAPLVIYLAFKDRSRFVAFHALQSLYFQLALLVVTAVGAALALVTCGLLAPGIAIAGVAAVVYSIIAAIQAYDGRLFVYVLVGDAARRQVGI